MNDPSPVIGSNAAGRDAAGRQTQTQARVVPDEIRQLSAAAKSLQSCVTLTPSFAANTGAAPYAVELQTLLGSVRNASAWFERLISFVDCLNAVGTPRDERALEVGAELMPVAVRHISRGREGQTAGKGRLSPGEINLATVWSRAHPGAATIPVWHAVTRGLVDLVGSCGKLPGAELYLGRTEQHQVEAAKLCREYREAKAEIEKLRRGTGSRADPKGDLLFKAETKRDQVLAQMTHLIGSISDVDPQAVRECCEALQLQGAVSPKAVAAVLDLFSGLGRLIESLALSPQTSPNLPPLACAELGGEELGKCLVAKEPVQFVLDTAPLSADEHRTENLAVLLREYAKLRQALVKIHEQWSEQKRLDEGPLQKTAAVLADTLTGIFGQDLSGTREIFRALNRLGDLNIRQAFAPLLLCEIVTDSPSHGPRAIPFLEGAATFEFIGPALAAVAAAEPGSLPGVERALKNGPLRPVWELAAKMQEQRGRPAQLAGVFKAELQSAAAEKGVPFMRKAALLHGLSLASADERVQRKLKGGLGDTSGINDLALAMIKDSKAVNSSEAHLIEQMRAGITRRISWNLDDYLGQKHLKLRASKFVERYLKLLRHPEMWEDLDASSTLANTFLLYGRPGVGKTFLAVCLANHYEIPLVRISSKEIEDLFAKGGENTQGKRLADLFSELLERKIAQAIADRDKRGAATCMLFFEELEGYVPQRDRKHPVQVQMTGGMLDLWESQIKAHMDIIFGAATNHIEMLDDAALRSGRFGRHWKVTMPGEADIRDILAGTFAGLDLTLPPDYAGLDHYQSLITTCRGLIPHEIQCALNPAATLLRIDQGQLPLALDDALLGVFVESVKDLKAEKYRRPRRKKSRAPAEAAAV